MRKLVCLVPVAMLAASGLTACNLLKYLDGSECKENSDCSDGLICAESTCIESGKVDSGAEDVVPAEDAGHIDSAPRDQTSLDAVASLDSATADQTSLDGGSLDLTAPDLVVTDTSLQDTRSEDLFIQDSSTPVDSATSTDVTIVADGSAGTDLMSTPDVQAPPDTATPDLSTIDAQNADATAPDTSVPDSSLQVDAGPGRDAATGCDAAGISPAIGDWTKLCTAHAPAPRDSHCSAYDSDRHVLVVFGGFRHEDESNPTSPAFADGETWEFDGSDWAQKFPAHAPPARSACGMVYRAATQETLLVGGMKIVEQVSTQNFDDTWLWDGVDWVEASTSSRIPAVHAPAVAYDSNRDRVVAVGGCTNLTCTSHLDGAWEWNGTDWVNIITTPRPAVRAGCGLAYDAVNSRTVLVGGSVSGSYFRDTWSWNGTAWTDHSDGVHPPEYSEYTMAFDSPRQRIVLFGRNDVYSVPPIETYEIAGTSWTHVVTTNRPEVRIYFTMAYDDYRNRTVLFGGRQGLIGYPQFNDTWVYLGQPASTLGTWNPTSTMSTPRAIHCATTLSSGKILVTGGYYYDGNGYALASAETYDPASGTWSSSGTMSVTRYHHAATLLSSGKVLVTGGYNGVYHSGAEILDPTNGSWSAAAPLPEPMFDHSATLLQSGKVLVAGGAGISDYLTRAELYDPGTNTWTAAAPLHIKRAIHTATLLQDGRVLVVGGTNHQSTAGASCEIYDPSANTWTEVDSLASPRGLHSATLLTSGRVLVSGGYGAGWVAGAEIYNPATNSWTSAGVMASAGQKQMTVLLPSGNVLAAGGYNGTYLATTEIFSVSATTWHMGTSMSVPRAQSVAALLPSGRVLVAGGVTAPEVYTGTAEIFSE